MNDAMNNWNVQLIGMLGIAAAVFAVFWAAEGLEEAWPAAAILLGFIAILHFGRDRSDTLNVMSGVGDERTRSLYTRAVAVAGSVMAFLLPGWWLVTVAQGDPDRTLTVLCAVFGFTFIAAVAVLARRS
jgi:4-amino-4-deoxy-L-arabinose transferase-like glycosyltransferase